MKNLKIIITAGTILLNFVVIQSIFSQQNWSWQNPLPQGNDLVGWTVGSNGVILKTRDGGLTWSEQTSGTTNDLKEVEFENENIGYVVGRTVILKTTDGGDNWDIKLRDTVFGHGGIDDLFFLNAQRG